MDTLTATTTTISDLGTGTHNFSVITMGDTALYTNSDAGTTSITITSINAATNDDLVVYPNPASNSLYIKNVEEVNSVSIFSLDGKGLNTSYNNNIVNISNLEKGVYILSVSTNKGTSLTKFIKE